MNHSGGGEARHEVSNLRWALLCTDTELPEWQARCVEQLLDLPFAELSLRIVDERRQHSGLRDRLRHVTPNNFLFQLWARGVMDSRAMRARDLGQRLEKVPVLTCLTRRVGKYSEHFEPEDLETIRAHNLDFLLRFSFGIIRGEILEVARFGVWSFHHGDEQLYRGSPACFWEIANGEAVTGAILQRLTDRLDGGIVLKKGHFKTVSYSYRRNLDSVLLGSAHWPAEVCRDIHSGSSTYLEQGPVATEAPVYRKPGNLRVVATWWKMTINFFREVHRFFFRAEVWAIQVRERTAGETLAAIETGTQLAEPHGWISRPDNRGYWADPFLLEHEERRYLLLEDFDHCVGTGVARIMPLSEDGVVGDTAHDLPVDGHASYPSIVRYGGRIYCVPETIESREVVLFEAVDLPATWKRSTVLLKDVEAADPTLFRHGGLWWLLFSDAQSDPDRNLCAWYAKDLLGNWRPHLRNPIKINVRGARPAGPVISHEGALYRPGQDCSRTYGGAVVLNRVVRLTPTEFEEEVVGVVAPDPDGRYPDGVHTLGVHTDVMVIDAKRFAFVPCATWRRLRTLPHRFSSRSAKRGSP